MNYNQLGLRIRQARKRMKLTQSQLGALVDVDGKYISKIECASTCVGLSLLVDLANALHVSTDELLCDSVDYAIYPQERILNIAFEKYGADNVMAYLEVIDTLYKKMGEE